MKEETPGHSRDASARGDYHHSSDVHVAGAAATAAANAAAPTAAFNVFLPDVCDALAASPARIAGPAPVP
ncbi:MAG: hypothetical protein ACREDT_11850 [Methylocella sp.]